MASPAPTVRRRFAAAVLALGLAWSGTAAAIDPVTLILLRMLRDKVVLRLADAAMERALRPAEATTTLQSPPALPGIPPATMPERERLRFLVDRNFTYLSAGERDRVYDALIVAVDDPANVSQREEIIAAFTQTAIAVGEAQRLLDRLSTREKREIAQAAASAYQALSAEDQREMLRVLRTREAPIPQDLNGMMLQAMAGD
ncbi:MAG: hypothetical protein JNJ44_07720 [Zoogloeaceae bacterium]|nr:hypothetical protein [Zoogloeaceae bacterium]